MKVSEKAALILINEDAKTYADLAAAREEITNIVFGLVLRVEQEPDETENGNLRIIQGRAESHRLKK